MGAFGADERVRGSHGGQRQFTLLHGESVVTPLTIEFPDPLSQRIRDLQILQDQLKRAIHELA